MSNHSNFHRIAKRARKSKTHSFIRCDNCDHKNYKNRHFCGKCSQPLGNAKPVSYFNETEKDREYP